MRVREIMTLPPQTCHLQTDLATASRRMEENGTGMLVVLDGHARVKGVVTDRDLAMALALDQAGIERLPVGRVMSRRVHTCTSEDDVEDALAQMSRHGVRRLPVTSGGDLKGVLSIDDIILWSVEQGAITRRALVAALRQICAASAAPPEPELPAL
jgi:CBS domain-containing protein